MQTLAEIQTAIAQLPIAEARKLTSWLQGYLEVAEDLALDADLAVDSATPPRDLRQLVNQAKAEIAAQRDHHHSHTK
jgi:hypothetical protein